MSVEREARRLKKLAEVAAERAIAMKLMAIAEDNPGPAGDKGDPGDPGPQGPTEGEPAYIQQTEPAGTSPWIWFKTNGSGQVIDILKG